ncbi:MAG: dTDP-4-dehydrorhamnose 3,5-epimerase, partial [Sinomicrobium sp.]|nr:dTDP-4-dehydrorhamnose 3,5-epimerase [Sinomicrobium sp.]
VFNRISGITAEFVQENQSVSRKGVLRGFHFQRGQSAQAKLVRVVKGEVQDVAVDLRRDSKTFGQHFSIILNDKDNYQLYIPKGFAHAFLSLTGEVVFSYKCDAYYDATSESGIIYNDPVLNVRWQLPDEAIILSGKDSNLPGFRSLFP